MARKNRELEQLRNGIFAIKKEIADIDILIADEAERRNYMNANNFKHRQEGLSQALWYLEVFGNIVRGVPKERPAENDK